MLRILSLFPLFLHAAYGVTISSNTRTDLFVVDQDVSPDGFTRPAVVAGTTATNAAVVGPLITGSRGGKYSINVHDQLTNVDMLKGTSIHWHGLLQRTTTWADGPSFVNQCPISPGHSFTYTFSSPDQAGTFWYHSHLGLQYCDGLRGPFVVYDKNDPHARRYDVDDETTVITLADWYHKLAKDFAGPAIPDAILINGKGRYSGGPASDLSVVTVQRNKRYRMRLVSMSCDANYVFQIVGHSLTIIEADGVSTHPHTVHSLQIFAGQRYSFVLKADQPVGNYWIRANPNIGNGLPNNFAGGLNSGILRYVGAPNAEPTATADATDLLLETDLHALTSPKVPGKPKPGGADVNINLVMGFSNGGFTINGVGFKSPTVPVLNQIMSGVRTAQELMPAGSIYELPRNKVVELSIPGGLAPGFPHPVHLHGHEFYVVRSAGSQVYNYANPVRRDVVSTGGPGDNVTIRFRSDNAGVWFLHCHIDPHLEAGFAVVFAETIPDIGRPAPPASWDDLCPTWDNLNSEDAKLVNGNGTDTALVSSLLQEASASPTPTTTELLTSPTIITDAPTSLSEDGADLETSADSSAPTASATPTA